MSGDGNGGEKGRHPNYRNPPEATRFKPGQSGNPGGRPKKSPTMREALERALQREVPAVIDGRRQVLPALDVLANALVAHLGKKPLDFVQVGRWLEGERPPAGTSAEPRDQAQDQALLDDLIRRRTRNAAPSEEEPGGDDES